MNDNVSHKELLAQELLQALPNPWSSIIQILEEHLCGREYAYRGQSGHVCLIVKTARISGRSVYINNDGQPSGANQLEVEMVVYDLLHKDLRSMKAELDNLWQENKELNWPHLRILKKRLIPEEEISEYLTSNIVSLREFAQRYHQRHYAKELSHVSPS